MTHRIGDIKAQNLIVLRELYANTIISDEILSRISLRIPTLTTAEKNALPPNDGTLVFDSTEGEAQIFADGSWASMAGGTVSTTQPGEFLNTSASTGTASGALVVTGGVGVGGDVNVGGGINAGGASSISDATQSIDEMTGALVVDGGVGIGKNLFVGEDLNVTGDTTLGGTLTVTDISLCTLATSGIVSVNDITQSIDDMSGALVVDGGVGISKNLNVGEELNVTGDSVIGGTLLVNSGNTSSSLVVSGGSHMQGELLVDENITFGGRLNGRVRTTASSTNLDNDYVLNVTTVSTVTLPPLADSNYTGVVYHIVKETTGIVTIATAVLADKIINSGIEVDTVDLSGPLHERVTLMNNGARWYTM
jgi:hypothetical protein